MDQAEPISCNLFLCQKRIFKNKHSSKWLILKRRGHFTGVIVYNLIYLQNIRSHQSLHLLSILRQIKYSTTPLLFHTRTLLFLRSRQHRLSKYCHPLESPFFFTSLIITTHLPHFPQSTAFVEIFKEMQTQNVKCDRQAASQPATQPTSQAMQRLCVAWKLLADDWRLQCEMQTQCNAAAATANQRPSDRPICLKFSNRAAKQRTRRTCIYTRVATVMHWCMRTIGALAGASHEHECARALV